VLARLKGAAGDAVAFAHGHILRVLAVRYVGLEVADGARLTLSPGAIGVLGHERQTEVIEGWNAVAGG
jgi:probable phosphoglycerate mutase